VGDLLGVEDDLDRLGVRAVVAIGRVGDVAAGVATRVEMTSGRLRSRSCIPQKQSPARIAFSVVSIIDRSSGPLIAPGRSAPPAR
jgi:hypothetical protein